MCTGNNGPDKYIVIPGLPDVFDDDCILNPIVVYALCSVLAAHSALLLTAAVVELKWTLDNKFGKIYRIYSSIVITLLMGYVFLGFFLFGPTGNEVFVLFVFTVVTFGVFVLSLKFLMYDIVLRALARIRNKNMLEVAGGPFRLYFIIFLEIVTSSMVIVGGFGAAAIRAEENPTAKLAFYRVFCFGMTLLCVATWAAAELYSRVFLGEVRKILSHLPETNHALAEIYLRIRTAMRLFRPAVVVSLLVWLSHAIFLQLYYFLILLHVWSALNFMQIGWLLFTTPKRRRVYQFWLRFTEPASDGTSQTSPKVSRPMDSVTSPAATSPTSLVTSPALAEVDPAPSQPDSSPASSPLLLDKKHIDKMNFPEMVAASLINAEKLMTPQHRQAYLASVKLSANDVLQWSAIMSSRSRGEGSSSTSPPSKKKAGENVLAPEDRETWGKVMGGVGVAKANPLYGGSVQDDKDVPF